MKRSLFILLTALTMGMSCSAPGTPNDQIKPAPAPAGTASTTAPVKHTQAVIVNFKYGIQGLDSLLALEDRLESVIAAAGAGEYDGHEIATDYSDGILYMYGPNADTLYKVIKPTLREASYMKAAKVLLRYGPPEDGVKSITTILD